MSLGKNITDLRKQKKLSQNQLALELNKINNELNVTSANISKYENDTSAPPIPILKALSKFFNISIDKLVENNAEDNTNVLLAKLNGMLKNDFELYIDNNTLLVKALRNYRGYPIYKDMALVYDSFFRGISYSLQQLNDDIERQIRPTAQQILFNRMLDLFCHREELQRLYNDTQKTDFKSKEEAEEHKAYISYVYNIDVYQDPNSLFNIVEPGDENPTNTQQDK